MGEKINRDINRCEVCSCRLFLRILHLFYRTVMIKYRSMILSDRGIGLCSGLCTYTKNDKDLLVYGW